MQGFKPLILLLCLMHAAADLVLSHQRIKPSSENNDGGLTAPLELYDGWGMSSTALDVNGDDILELAVGADPENKFLIVFLNADGTVDSHQTISDTLGGFTGNYLGDSNFGLALANLGDYDGDGVPEIAVGADKSTTLYIVFLNADGTCKSHQRISTNSGDFTAALTYEDDGLKFANELGSIPDMNGDGLSELAVGMYCGWVTNNEDECPGYTYIMFMHADGTVDSHQRIGFSLGGFTADMVNDDAFGKAFASLGDFNEDDISEIAIGAYGDDDARNNAGAVYIIYLISDGTVESHQKISGLAGNFTGVLTSDDHDGFGSSLSQFDDYNDDGVPELAVGSHCDDDGSSNAGAIFLVFLKLNGGVLSHLKISNSAGGFTGTFGGSEYFGSSVTMISDLNGDGIPELAGGSGTSAEGDALYIFFISALCSTEVSGSDYSDIGSISVFFNDETITVTCEDGYEGGGSLTLDSDCSILTGACTALPCNATEVTNSDHAATGSLTGVTGEEVVVSCDDGYTINGDGSENVTVVCTANATFNDVITCVASNCADTEVDNSDYATTGSITGVTGDTISVSCDTGYVGGGEIECTTTGVFDLIEDGSMDCSLPTAAPTDAPTQAPDDEQVEFDGVGVVSSNLSMVSMMLALVMMVTLI